MFDRAREEAGRCKQCWEAGKLSVWIDYEPQALWTGSAQSCQSEEEDKRGAENRGDERREEQG